MKFTALLVLVLISNALATAATDRVVALADAPTNIWARIAQSPTGWRDQPIFVYAGNIKRWVMASGYQNYGGDAPRHYDTEEFDLPTARWFNAYPADVSAGRPESGPVGAEYTQSRIKQGWNGFELFYKDGENLRVGAGGQWLETRGYHEWCYDSDNGKVYAYLHDKTLAYDPAKRGWEDLKAKPRTSCRIWGAMCYDPVNKEILHAGGDGASAEIGTWVYSIENNAWRKLEFGSDDIKALQVRAKALRWEAKGLLGGVCNRFTIAQTPDEAKADLTLRANTLVKLAQDLAADILLTKLKGAEASAGESMAHRLIAATEGLRAVAPNLGGKISPDIIAQVRVARVCFEQAVAAIASEPTGRARSQTTYDPEHKQIILFGGDELDRVLSDTWIYDCTTRTWTQKFPAVCPKPRAGHILAWLPKAKKIVLAGGYSREPLAQDIWTYDVAADKWNLLLQMPLVRQDDSHKVAPQADDRGIQVGAVNGDDVLVCLGNASPGLITWACKVDASKSIDATGQSAASGDYTFNRIDPAKWEKAATPDAAQTKKFYDDLRPNQWTALDFPLYAPGATNRWGTTAYDTDRHQFLFWGGGHATSHEDDVAHYSVLGNCWTIGYHPDDPIERVYAEQPTPLSFNDRAHVSIHAYKAYCYDPTAQEMFFFDRAYSPAVREWEPKPYPGLEHRGPMASLMRSTPGGAVTYSEEGLFRFDAKSKRWAKLPWEGQRPEKLYCDGHSLCYDGKRDCLWVTNEKEVYRYDFATGKGTKTTPSKPKSLEQFLFWGEQVYLPEADLILLMRLFKTPDGKWTNVAWDPSDGKFYWADLKFVEMGKDVQFKDKTFSWSDALQYDPTLKIVLLNNSSERKVWAMKFDRKTVKLTEMTD